MTLSAATTPQSTPTQLTNPSPNVAVSEKEQAISHLQQWLETKANILRNSRRYAELLFNNRGETEGKIATRIKRDPSNSLTAWLVSIGIDDIVEAEDIVAALQSEGLLGATGSALDAVRSLSRSSSNTAIDAAGSGLEAIRSLSLSPSKDIIHTTATPLVQDGEEEEEDEEKIPKCAAMVLWFRTHTPDMSGENMKKYAAGLYAINVISIEQLEKKMKLLGSSAEVVTWLQTNVKVDVDVDDALDLFEALQQKKGKGNNVVCAVTLTEELPSAEVEKEKAANVLLQWLKDHTEDVKLSTLKNYTRAASGEAWCPFHLSPLQKNGSQ